MMSLLPPPSRSSTTVLPVTPPEPIVTLVQAESFLYDRLNFEKSQSTKQYPFRLDRMRLLVAAAGYQNWLYEPNETSDSVQTDRDRHPKIVHIAGTKGKGSTTTILQSILTAAGHRVGTYTSPHLDRLTGRFRIDGVAVDDESFIATIDRLAVSTVTVPSADQITFFELTTTAAIDLFARGRCDVVILETGLGGRLDSTNVFDADFSAITTIGLDHQHILGDDHQSIAAEKAGIIKNGRPVFSSVRQVDAAAVIQAVADKQHSPIQKIDRDWTVQFAPHPDWGSDIRVQHHPSGRTADAALSIEGEHQAINASLAIAIAISAFNVSDDSIRTGADASRPPARLERYRSDRGQTILLDSAHNPDSIAALCQVLRRRLHGAFLSIVFATSIDKDAGDMLKQLTSLAGQLYLTKFSDNPRSVPPTALLQCIDAEIASNPKGVAAKIEVIDDAGDALSVAIENTPVDGWIVICGSFFLAAQLRQRCLATCQDPSDVVNKSACENDDEPLGFNKRN